MDMNKTLVAYFSCTGTTRRAAQALAAAVGARGYDDPFGRRCLRDSSADPLYARRSGLEK